MKFLYVAPYYYPATYWGGPIWSTKVICDGIKQRPGCEVRVLTTDAASPARADHATPAIQTYPVHFMRRIAGHSIAPGLLWGLPKALAWADVVHLTGTYNFPTLPALGLARLMGRPVVWSPRGALQATVDWDAAPRKRIKRSFERVANVMRPNASILHVTSAAEATQSTQRLGDITTALIPNCVDIPAQMPGRSDDDLLRLIYLGRLHPKKGLDLLIAAMQRLPTHVRLDIYGTGDANYLRQLRHKIGSDTRIQFRGHVEDDAKAQAFADADLFVLPSYSENFGIAVAEALAHGVPVITTTGTPWQALDHHGCGRCIALDRDDLADTIKDLSTCDLPAMGAKGRAWMMREFSASTMVDAFETLYRGMVTGHPQGITA